MKKFLAISGLIAFLLSILVGELVDRGMTAYFHSRYDYATGDGPLIMQALLSGYVFRPIIACICGVVIILITWLIIKLKGGKVHLKEGLVTIMFVALSTAAISIAWSSYEIFVVNRFWP